MTKERFSLPLSGKDVTDLDVTSLGKHSASTSLSLLERAKGADKLAWERIVELYGPLVYVWCCRSGLQEADAQDVGQGVFQSVFLNLANFRRDRPLDTFRGWLRVIVRNKITDFVRKRARSLEIPGAGTDKLIAEMIVTESSTSEENTSEWTDLLRRAILLIREEFEDQTWKAFWAVAVDDCSPAATAATLGLTVNAVYLAKSRIICRLRDLYGELLDGLN